MKIELTDVEVITGYFTVELDFGSDVFDGNANIFESDPACWFYRSYYGWYAGGVYVDA